MSDVPPLPRVGDGLPPTAPADLPSPSEEPTSGAEGPLDSGREQDGDAPRSSRVPAPKVGELVVAWRITLVAAWAGAFLAFMAVWKASEEIGIATWWLGPRSNPQPVVIRLIPFLVCATCGAVSSFRIRHVSLISMVGAALLGVIAVPDFSRSVGLAVVEVLIAVAVGLVAAASLTGRYRPQRSLAAETHVAGSDVAG